MIATLVRSIFEQADRDATWAQLGDVVDKLTAAGSATPRYMSWTPPMTSWPSGLPGRALPKIRPTTPRLNKEIRRRTDVVGSPQPPAVTRLLGALLVEQNDEWIVETLHGRRNSRCSSDHRSVSCHPRPSMSSPLANPTQNPELNNTPGHNYTRTPVHQTREQKTLYTIPSDIAKQR